MVTYQKADKNLYIDFKDDLEKLYLKTFTKGISAQQITNESAEHYLKDLFEEGYGIFGFSDHKLISALLSTPVNYDKDRPDNIKSSYNNQNTLYIAEVLVDENFRGQGLGKRLMEVFDEQLDNNIHHTLLRVWRENKPAIALYEKMGFKTCGEITQEKTRPKTKEKFIMHKNYMLKSY
jgi:GNAT superfamily N-acetyltransferase